MAEGVIIDLETPDGSSIRSASPAPQSGNFTDRFWGNDCRGFDVLFSNLKSNVTGSRYLADYVKERVSIEKSYVKSLQKLSRSLNPVPDSNLGGVYPVWLVFLQTLDQVCISSERQVTSLTEIWKQILEYSNRQDDKMKSNIKGDIDTAHKSLTMYRNSITLAKKSRKSYRQSCVDLAEQESELERLRTDPTKTKDVEKLESKLKKSTTHMEHMKTEHQKAIQSHNNAWKDFEEKMIVACKKFQSLEEEHLTHMRQFLLKVAESHENNELTLYKEYKKFSERMDSFHVQKLMTMFSQLKGTGKIKPELLKFSSIQIDSIKLSHRGSLGEGDNPSSGDTKPTASKKRLFKKQKKVKNQIPSSDTINTVSVSTPNDDSFKVDEEGYRIRPPDADKIAKFSDEEQSNGESSESDSDSDDEPEKRIQKVKIKDASPSVVVSVDELNMAAKTLKLEPLGGIRKSGSSQSLDNTLSTSNTPHLIHRSSPVDSQSLFDQPIDDSVPSTRIPPSTSVPIISVPSTSVPIISVPSTSVPLTSVPSTSLPLTSVPSTSIPLTSVPSTSVPSTSIPLTSISTVVPSSVQLNLDLPTLPSLPNPISSSPLVATNISSTSSLPPWDSVPSFDSSLSPLGPSSTLNWTTFSQDTSNNDISGDISPPKEELKISIHSTSLDIRDKLQASPKLNISLPGTFLPPPPSTSGRRRDNEAISSPKLNNRVPSPSSDVRSLSPRLGSLQRPSSIYSSIDRTSPVSPLISTHRSVQSTGSIVSNSIIGGGGVVPIAVAFQETCNAIFKGDDLSKAIVKVTGEMDFSFPSNYIPHIESHDPLKFGIENTSDITKLLHNQNLLSRDNDGSYTFLMDKLSSHLKRLSETNESPFHNIHALKYEVVVGDSSKLPLQLMSSWQCDSTTTNIEIKYIYKSTVFPLSPKPTLTNGTITLAVEGGVTTHTLDSSGVWQPDRNIVIWKLSPIQPSDNEISGVVNGKFNVSSGPTKPSSAVVQFVCDGSTLSGIKMILNSSQSYKISLRKNKCIAGKYIAEPT